MNEIQKGFIMIALEMAANSSDQDVEERFNFPAGSLQKLREAVKKHGLDNLPDDILEMK